MDELQPLDIRAIEQEIQGKKIVKAPPTMEELKAQIEYLKKELEGLDTYRTNCYLLMGENFKLRRLIEIKEEELEEAARQLKEEREYSKKVKHAFDKIKVWYQLSEPGGPKYK